MTKMLVTILTTGAYIEIGGVMLKVLTYNPLDDTFRTELGYCVPSKRLPQEYINDIFEAL
jgi:hypothetical protein